jgi:hypothetical protein
MAPDALEAARSRYAEAYEAYQQASRRVAEKLANGLIPTGTEIESEGKAAQQLAVARRGLLDAMAKLTPAR